MGFLLFDERRMYTGIQRWVTLAEPVTHYEVRLSSNEDGAPRILVPL